jgi:hypothetical protein
MSLLFSQPQLLNQGPVTFDILIFQVVQEPPALAHQLDQTPTGVMILGVRLEMVSQVSDPLAQDGYLHLR